MDSVNGNSIPSHLSMNEGDISKAAAEFLTASSERRKRSRASIGGSAELARKRGAMQPIDGELARKSTMALMQESPSFKRLVELEGQLDLAIMRKQTTLTELLKTETQSESRIFRLYIFNTYRSQPGTDGVTPDDVGSWSLRIQGKLLPKGDGAASDSVPPAVLNSVDVSSGTAATTGTGAGMKTTLISSTANGIGGNGTNTTNASASVSNSQFAQRILNTNMADGASNGPGGSTENTSVITGEEPRCSDVFNRIVVELDKEIYPKNNVIEWKRGERENACDGFEISRAGSQEFVAKIYLFVDHKPARYRLSADLARIIGSQYETRSGVFSSIWQYVKKHRLQCVDNRTAVRLDDGLKSLLGPSNKNLRTVKTHSLFSILKNHMGPAEPLRIEYEVRLSGDVVDNQDCYDIHVHVADMSMLELARKTGVFGLPVTNSSEYEALNERHLQALEKIAYHKKRREFFEGFCADPVQFINHLILSQTRDLKVLGGSTGRNPEEERRTGFYQQQWVHEAVPRYLLRKAIADTAEDTTENGLKSQQ